ncbi:MAG: histidine kinase [Blautia sp.]|nr:histidine kinase [Blautia sp.]
MKGNFDRKYVLGSVMMFLVNAVMISLISVCAWMDQKHPLSRSQWWAVTIACVILGVFVVVIYLENANRMKRNMEKINEELQRSMEREHKEALLRQQFQYAELQNQINPHFLYNTLETIRGQAIIDDNYQIADMTETLAKYFRYNISKNKDDVTLVQELENIRNYIHIQQYRFQDRFLFEIYPHVEYEEYARCLIPKMTLQPIVENAIFHGMEQKIQQGHIYIHIDTTDRKLIVRVADDGMGMTEERLAELNRSLKEEMEVSGNLQTNGHNGIAVKNVNNRLKMLYGPEYGLHISSTLNLGTEVEIVIPKIPYSERV